MAVSKPTLGARIRALRKQKGMTQDYLSELASIDPKSLSRIEGGRFNPAIETLEGLATALNVSMRDFFTDESTSIEELRYMLLDAIIQFDQAELTEVVGHINRIKKKRSTSKRV